MNRATIAIGAVAILMVTLSPTLSRANAVTATDAQAQVNAVKSDIHSLQASDLKHGSNGKLKNLLKKADRLVDRINKLLNSSKAGTAKTAFLVFEHLERILEHTLTDSALAKVGNDIDNAASTLKQLCKCR